MISSVTYAKAARAFDADRRSGAVVDFTKTEQSLYLEYGLQDRWTVVASGAVQDISYISKDGPQRYSGLGTSRLGVRYRIKTDGPWVVAVQPSAVIPAGGESVPDADLGRGDWGAELRLLAGRSQTFGGKPGFVDVQALFDMRTGSAPEQVGIDATLGVDVHPRVQVLMQSFAQFTTEGRFGADRVLENDSLKLQGSVVYRFKPNTSLQLGAFETVLGRNTVRQRGVSLALWQSF